jgi:hypothetical protein
MIDKDWLNKLTVAYRVYAEQQGEDPAVSAFISWLYKQYGIIQPPEDKK